MDRIELGIVACLFMLVAVMWQLWDLPGQIQQDRRHELKVVTPAQAEGR